MTTANVYVIGTMVRCYTKAAFKDANGNAVDPSSVTFEYLPPNATTPTTLLYQRDLTVIRDGTGLYHVDLIGNVIGKWKYYFKGVAPTVADEGSFWIKTTPFS